MPMKVEHEPPLPPSSLPPPTPPPPPPHALPQPTTFSTHPVHKTLTSVANLANLLPTGTVLAFRTLSPSFSNKGVCQISNQCLTAALIIACSITCFITTFTDSFTDSEGKLYYGMATLNGLHVFSREASSSANHLEAQLLQETEEGEVNKSRDQRESVDLSKFKIGAVDIVHALVSVLVFLAFALSDNDVQKCFLPLGGKDLDVLMKNLPLAAGMFSSFFFTVVPTTRRGIGYADVAANYKFK